MDEHGAHPRPFSKTSRHGLALVRNVYLILSSCSIPSFPVPRNAHPRQQPVKLDARKAVTRLPLMPRPTVVARGPKRIRKHGEVAISRCSLTRADAVPSRPRPRTGFSPRDQRERASYCHLVVATELSRSLSSSAMYNHRMHHVAFHPGRSNNGESFRWSNRRVLRCASEGLLALRVIGAEVHVIVISDDSIF